jgi:hypothetical protein
MYFSLDRKVRKDQDCKSLAEYFTRTTEKIKPAQQNGRQARPASNNIIMNAGLRQQFSLFVVLIHILYAKYLRS